MSIWIIVYYIAKSISTRNIKINNTMKIFANISIIVHRRLHSWRLKYNNLLFGYTCVHVHVQVHVHVPLYSTCE